MFLNKMLDLKMEGKSLIIKNDKYNRAINLRLFD
jgi:hypothetical protein